METVLYPYAWLDGKIVRVEDLDLPLSSPTAQYGVGLFEGIMAYPAKSGLHVLALHQHLGRLIDSAERAPYAFRPPKFEEAVDAVISVLKENSVRDRAYLRPTLFHEGTGDVRLGPALKGPCHFGIYVQRWEERYLPKGGLACKISPYLKTFSPIAQMKTCGNYAAAIEAKLDARQEGKDEALMFYEMDGKRLLAEGTSENVILDWRGKLIEPKLVRAPILPGITRQIAIDLLTSREPAQGPIEQTLVSEEMLWEADGMILTGTAAEIVHIASVGTHVYNDGRPTPTLKKIIDAYQALITLGASPMRHLLTHVDT